MCDLESSIPDWLIFHPETAAVFDALHLTTSCAGKSLRTVCEENNLNPADVHKELTAAIPKEN
jgi:regulator of cell morphogenesis and NO signaling